MQKTRGEKTEVIMAHHLESFADLSMKVVAVRTADDSNFGFEFPASGAQSTPSALTRLRLSSPLNAAAIRLRSFLDGIMEE
jgi:hypothetical protein